MTQNARTLKDYRKLLALHVLVKYSKWWYEEANSIHRIIYSTITESKITYNFIQFTNFFFTNNGTFCFQQLSKMPCSVKWICRWPCQKCFFTIEENQFETNILTIKYFSYNIIIHKIWILIKLRTELSCLSV